MPVIWDTETLKTWSELISQSEHKEHSTLKSKGQTLFIQEKRRLAQSTSTSYEQQQEAKIQVITEHSFKISNSQNWENTLYVSTCYSSFSQTII